METLSQKPETATETEKKISKEKLLELFLLEEQYNEALIKYIETLRNAMNEYRRMLKIIALSLGFTSLMLLVLLFITKSSQCN